MSKSKDSVADNEAENIENTKDASSTPEKEKICFVIMPISDHPDYEPGHFGRVYKHIIQPACKNAGFKPLRADEVNSTNMIVIDILQNIINSEMAICDLSSRNPNVLYEGNESHNRPTKKNTQFRELITCK